eukprot:4092291-Amphidinium_carterae.2
MDEDVSVVSVMVCVAVLLSEPASVEVGHVGLSVDMWKSVKEARAVGTECKCRCQCCVHWSSVRMGAVSGRLPRRARVLWIPNARCSCRCSWKLCAREHWSSIQTFFSRLSRCLTTFENTARRSWKISCRAPIDRCWSSLGSAGRAGRK